jgi:hypothetical protein
VSTRHCADVPACGAGMFVIPMWSGNYDKLHLQLMLRFLPLETSCTFPDHASVFLEH